MTGAQYERVSAEYERSYGELLVADIEWVGPIFEMCEGAVSCDGNFDPEVIDFEEEVVSRTAAVICLMTYGVGRWRSTKRVSS